MNPSPPIDQPSSAALRILCGGAMHPILDALTGAIARIAGGPVMVRYASSGGVKARVLEGEPADVVITTAAAIDHLGDHDKTLAGTATAVARSSIGVAVRAVAARPDIGSVASFMRALRQANSIAIADPITGSPSGNHLVAVFNRLAMTAELRSFALSTRSWTEGSSRVSETYDDGGRIISPRTPISIASARRATPPAC
jgi:molybdate transport system substrate-binding protein